MTAYRFALVLAGAFATAAIGYGSHVAHDPGLAARLLGDARTARDSAGGNGIGISIESDDGMLTRHAALSGGADLPEGVRTRAAQAIEAVPGIGGVRWVSGGAVGTAPTGTAQHCQENVEAILKARTIRFGEMSAVIDPASERLLDEVAVALRPCAGSIIAITGHTDGVGEPEANRALSRARAEAVRWALVGRGIPGNVLRAVGKGAEAPLTGLEQHDAANRRIEFSIIKREPMVPTPIDTPGPG